MNLHLDTRPKTDDEIRADLRALAATLVTTADTAARAELEAAADRHRIPRHVQVPPRSAGLGIGAAAFDKL